MFNLSILCKQSIRLFQQKLWYELISPLMHKQNALRITKGNNLTELAPSPYFSIINVHLVDISVFAKFYEIPSLPFQDTEKPKCNGRTDEQPENSIPPPPPTNTVCGGYKHSFSIGLYDLKNM